MNRTNFGGQCKVWPQVTPRKHLPVSIFMGSLLHKHICSLMSCMFLFTWNFVCSHSHRYFGTHCFWTHVNHKHTSVHWHRLTVWVLFSHSLEFSACIYSSTAEFTDQVFCFWDQSLATHSADAVYVVHHTFFFCFIVHLLTCFNRLTLDHSVVCLNF